MRLTLSAEDDRGEHFSEMQMVKQALRAYVIECEELAAHHSRRGASAAAMWYMQSGWVIRHVLEREFNDEVPERPPRVTGIEGVRFLGTVEG